MIRQDILRFLNQSQYKPELSKSPPALAPKIKPPRFHLGSREGLSLGSFLAPTLNKVAFIDPPEEKQNTDKVSNSSPALEGFDNYQFWMGSVAANGKRESMVLIPPTTDLSKPIEILYYFHGHNGSIQKSLNAPQGIGKTLRSIGADIQRNPVFVLPQGPSKKEAHQWMSPKANESITALQAHTLNTLKRYSVQALAPQVKQISVFAHSAGGQALVNASRNGLKADKIVFLDASYGWWASAVLQAQSKTTPHLEMKVIYRPGSKTATGALRLKNERAVALLPTSISHRAIPRFFIQR